MNEESIIEVFEHERDDEDKPLGIVSVRGDITYAKIQVEIIEDGIFYEPFSFVYTKNYILNRKQKTGREMTFKRKESVISSLVF